MKLKLCDIEIENDGVAKKYYLDILDISAKMGEEKDNQLFQWVKPLHLDDELRNPNPPIVTHACEFGVDVERVLFEELHSESFSKEIEDSFQVTLNSPQEVDFTSASQSSRPSVVGTYVSSYDGPRGGTNDGGDNAEEDIGEC